MDEHCIASRIITEIVWQWLNHKDEEIRRQALSDLFTLSLVNSRYRRQSVPYIFRHIVFEAKDKDKPWVRGSQALSVLDMIRTNWWHYTRSVVFKCDACAFDGTHTPTDISLRRSLGNPELGHIFRFLNAAPALHTVEIDLAQSEETGWQELVPWKYFALNCSIIEAFIRDWPKTNKPTQLVIRYIEAFPFNHLRRIESLHLDTSTLHWNPIVFNSPLASKTLKLYCSPQALRFYKNLDMHFNFLTSLYISVADEGDFKDTYWLMARVSNTVESITLSFRYYASLKPFPKMKNYDLFTLSNLNYLLIEFQANNVGPAYRFLHRFRHGANNLQTLHLVADGTTYPSLGSAIYINKTDWSFFEALQMNPPIFPALKQINLELARNADLRGQATLTLDDFESNLFDLRNDRGIDLTFRHYNYH